MNDITKTVYELINTLINNDTSVENDQSKKEEIDKANQEIKEKILMLIEQSKKNRLSPLTQNLSIDFANTFTVQDDNKINILSFATHLPPNHKEIIEQLCEDFSSIKNNTPILEAIHDSLRYKENNYFQFLMDQFIIKQNKITYMDIANYNFLYKDDHKLYWNNLSDDNLRDFMNKFCEKYSTDSKECAEKAMETLKEILLKAASQETRFDIILECGLKFAEKYKKEWQENLSWVLNELLEKATINNNNSLPTYCLKENHNSGSLNKAIRKLLCEGAESKFDFSNLDELLDHWKNVQILDQEYNKIEVMDHAPICRALNCQTILKNIESNYSEGKDFTQQIQDIINCDKTFFIEYFHNIMSKKISSNPYSYDMKMFFALTKAYLDIKSTHSLDENDKLFEQRVSILLPIHNQRFLSLENNQITEKENVDIKCADVDTKNTTEKSDKEFKSKDESKNNSPSSATLNNGLFDGKLLDDKNNINNNNSSITPTCNKQ